MGREIGKIRNVSIIAHSGAGKTTLGEAILFNAGATERLGRVDDGTSVLDFEPEEIARKMSISASLHHYEWNRHHINLIDTPGFANFLTETRNALRVSGGAVVILSAISGVKIQTEKIWQFADEYEIPRIAFVNKMDRERASFLRAVDDMEKAFGARGIPIQLPIGAEEGFRGVVDLIEMKAYIYNGEGSFDIAEIPPEMMEDAESFRVRMVEAVAEGDDILLEKYLEGGELSREEILQGLRESVITNKFVPVLCGSALKNIGVKQLMDAINLYLPSPLDKGTVTGKDPATGEDKRREPSPDGPFSAFVFKTLSDPYAGKLSIFRVYSGTIKGDSHVLNTSKGAKERVGQLYILEGKKYRPVESLSAGDIGAAAKLKETATGDTLCDDHDPIVFPPLPPVSPVLSYAILPKTKADEDKVHGAIAKLIEEDPTLQFSRDEQTKEFIISGLGQVHLEVAVEKLKRKYGVEVDLKTPKVPYKETIRTTVKVQGKYKKQSGGRGQYGDTWLKLEPLPRGKGFEFVDEIVGGVVPKQFIPAVEKGIREAMEHGVLAGYPVVDVKVTLFDGSHHSVDSSELAFKIAASMGFRKGMAMAKPVLLEPIMAMEIIVPDENLGDVIGDLNSRRGKIQGVEPRANSQCIKALVPMAEVLTYANDLRSLTGGRGIFTMEFSHYEEVPTHLREKIISAAKEGK